jgi:hypothetical protein
MLLGVEEEHAGVVPMAVLGPLADTESGFYSGIAVLKRSGYAAVTASDRTSPSRRSQVVPMQRLVRSLLSGFVLASTLVASHVAQADVPPLVPLQGVLLSSEGYPVNAEAGLALTFRIYATETGGAPLHQELQVVPIRDGMFHVYLGDGAALDLDLFEAGDAWVGIAVEGDAELSPRIQVGSVAYAAWAANAASIEWSNIRNRPAGLDDGGTTYTGGPGIRIAAEVVSLSSIGCSAGQSWVWSGTQWECRDAGRLYTGGFGITISPEAEIAVDYDTIVGIVEDEAYTTPAELIDALGTTYERPLDRTCPTGIESIAPNGTVVCAAASSGDISAVLTPPTSGLIGGALSGDVTLGVNFTQVQRRVSGICDPDRFFTGIGESGVPVCAPASVATPAGSRTVQARILNNAACTYGISAINEDGTVVCAAESFGVSYTAGTGITIAGTTISVNTSQLQVRLGYSGATTSIGCPYGISYIEPANGLVYCTPFAVQNRVCGQWQYLRGFNSDGSPICASLGGWFNRRCISFIAQCDDWVDNPFSNSNVCRISHVTPSGDVFGQLGDGYTHYQPNWARSPGTYFPGIRVRGTVDSRDRLLASTTCFEE